MCGLQNWVPRGHSEQKCVRLKYVLRYSTPEKAKEGGGRGEGGGCKPEYRPKMERGCSIKHWEVIHFSWDPMAAKQTSFFFKEEKPTKSRKCGVKGHPQGFLNQVLEHGTLTRLSAPQTRACVPDTLGRKQGVAGRWWPRLRRSEPSQQVMKSRGGGTVAIAYFPITPVWFHLQHLCLSSSVRKQRGNRTNSRLISWVVTRGCLMKYPEPIYLSSGGVNQTSSTD